MTDERTRMRRKDRAMPGEAKIEELLHRAQIGFIATCVDDQPFINSNFFWYDPTTRRIYFHTANEGRTRQNVESNPNVCFSVAEMGRLLPAEKAYDFSTEYSGVCVFGRARVIVHEDEARYGLQGLLDKYFPELQPGQDYRPMTHEEIARTSVYAIEIESWSGKEKVAPV
jgi:nitroimidazol reductase NimA-like FMN-containing flavoprotein (pyridoxamine 5'-phosphate oxidase superfamily)